MTYFISKEGRQFGPFTTADISKRLKTGVLASDDLCWTEGEEAWLRIGERPEFQPNAPESSPTEFPQPKLRWGAVLGCIGLVLCLQLVVGALIAFFRIPLDSERMPILVDCASAFANFLSFFLAGLLFKFRRWTHLLLVWAGVCGFNFACSLVFAQIAVVSGSIWMLGELLVAGLLSGVMQKKAGITN